MGVRHMPKGRACGVAPFDGFGRFTGNPIGHMAGFIQVPGAIQIVVVVHAVHELFARMPLRCQEHFVIVYGSQFGPAFLSQ